MYTLVVSLQESRKLARAGVLVAGILACLLRPVSGAETGGRDATGSTDHSGNKRFSLIEAAPALYWTAKRDPKFYGDPNTTHGSLRERSFLFGEPGGTRDRLNDNGVYFDASVTQFLQGNVSGGARTSSSPRYNGSADAWLWIDTAKAGLWDGGALFAHSEVNWATDMNADVGSMLPANFDAVMPAAPATQVALSELYLIQSLSEKWVGAVGKIDMAAWADVNMFANNERTQYQYTGLVSNAIAGVFFPYTTLGAWLTWTPSKAHTLTAVYAQSEGSATVSGFDTLFNGNNSYAGQWIYRTKLGDKPGQYVLAAAYSSKTVQGFALNSRFQVRPISPSVDDVVRVPTLDTKSNNYAVIGNFSQFFWTKPLPPGSGRPRKELPPVGVGLFGRFGWAPEDRNVITQFYSLGVGGYGMLIPGRDYDQWGVGWAGSYISSDLRDLPGRAFRSWEHAVELFYSFAVTPAANLSLNAQVIEPAIAANDTAFTFGARLKVDF